MRFLISLTLISLIVGTSVFADPWLCGTPLLHQEHINEHPPEAIPAAPAAPAHIGHVERFFIHIPETEVVATCIAKSEHLYVYVDNSVRDLFSDAEAVAVAREFDNRIYPEVRKWMGTEWKPGLDRDNRITLLMHDVGMNQSGADYGGYFSPTDQLPTLPNSNRREMLYMDVYQFRERSRHTFHSSLAHEFAHLINWFQNGGTTDQRWLEEGTASFVEWAVYGTVHNIFVDGYLANPSVSLAYANTRDTYYGGTFLLMLYLYEQYGGPEFIRRIIETDALGEQAIDAALSGSGKSERFPEVFLNWGLANWANTQAQNKQLGYSVLRDRKVSAVVPRVRSYPNEANNIPINQWGAYYVVFENLPETLDLSVIGSGSGNLYATTLYLPSNGRPVVTPIPFSTKNRGDLRRAGLLRNGKIVLMLTADVPQTFRYIVDLPAANNVGAVDAPRQHVSDTIPDAVTYALDNLTQRSTPPAKLTPETQLEPRTQIHLASDYTDVAIGGPNASHLYAASGWGLEIFTLTEPTQPARIGEIATPGRARSAAVEGDTAYVADGAAGVQVIDIADPNKPSIVKTIGGFTSVHRVRVADDQLYALDRERGMLVFNLRDVHNMQIPRPRRFFRTAGTPINVAIHDGIVYFSDDRHGLIILDPSPFGDFVVRGVVPILSNAHEVEETRGTTHTYVASGNLILVDVTDDQNPEIDFRLNTPGLATGIQFRNDTVYLADRQTGLHIINVRNRKQPRRISTQPTFGNATDIVLRNTLAYIADGRGGIQTIDVSESESPKWLHRYASGGTAYGLDVVETDAGERTVYVANGVDGLKTLEFTTPYQGTVTKRLSLPTNIITSNNEFEAASCTKIRVQDGHGFVAAETGMYVVNLATDTIAAHVSTTSPVSDIALHEGYAYLCAGSLIVVDSRVPQQSRIVSRRDMRGSAYRVVIDSNTPAHAYVAALEGGLHVFDITGPAVPRLVGSHTTQGNATGVALADERAYLLDSGIGVAVLDVVEPNNLKLQDVYESEALLIDATVSGSYLYLLDSNSVQVIDTRTVKASSRFRGLRFPFELKLVGSALYVADLYQLRIFRVHIEGYSLAVEEPTQSDWTPNVIKPVFVNRLSQNFPNPFNPETWIPYQLASDTNVSLHIYDVQGRRIYSKALGYRKTGSHTAYWDGRNATGESVASGVYFYEIQAGTFHATRKMFIQR
ncbi:hypothetical protein C6500_02830 [Candidatus Poribacteria bacterium]|nr:MAG: hypothetical protein C6500_02830 [Candidatus Poribacteria bacterium]